MADERYIQKLIETSKKNQVWFDSHYEEFRKKYEDMFLAIKDKKDIAAAEKLEDLINELEARGEDIGLILITSFSSKGVASIFGLECGQN